MNIAQQTLTEFTMATGIENIYTYIT